MWGKRKLFELKKKNDKITSGSKNKKKVGLINFLFLPFNYLFSKTRI